MVTCRKLIGSITSLTITFIEKLILVMFCVLRWYPYIFVAFQNVAFFFSEFDGYTLDIVGMCETRLNAAIEPLYTLPTHQAFFDSRDTNEGGTLLHIRNNLKASKSEDLSL